MRPALLLLSIQGGCCRSREPTAWDQPIAGSDWVRCATRIDPPNLAQPTCATGLFFWPLRQRQPRLNNQFTGSRAVRGRTKRGTQSGTQRVLNVGPSENVRKKYEHGRGDRI